MRPTCANKCAISAGLAGVTVTANTDKGKSWFGKLWRKVGSTVLEVVQTGLDVVGLVPGLGEAADLINAGIYALRGDYTNAALSLAATVPFAGWAATGGKWAIKANRAFKASKGGTKLISQFSTSTIDDAVNLVMRNSNDVRHIFASKHNLGPLVNKLGGQENTIRAALNAANGKLPANGVFNNIPVNVGGQTVFIRGSVVNGVPRIGTMFIP